jgi:hypothetical protein
MTPRLLANLALFGLAAACTHTPPVTRISSPAPGDYFPLAVGNAWTYVDESPALPADRRGALRTVRILSRDASGYFHDDERGELRADGDCVHDRVRRLLCAPIEVGRAWSSVVSVASTERYEIAAVGETIDTPAGRFRGCVRVRSQNRAGPETTAVLESAYCPGVGLARIETFAVVKGTVTPQVRAVLRSFRVEGR